MGEDGEGRKMKAMTEVTINGVNGEVTLGAGDKYHITVIQRHPVDTEPPIAEAMVMLDRHDMELLCKAANYFFTAEAP